MNFDINLTLLSANDVDSNNKDKLLILNKYKYGLKAAITDFAILNNGSYSNNYVKDCYNLKERMGYYCTKTLTNSSSVISVEPSGTIIEQNKNLRNINIRPAFKSDYIYNTILNNEGGNMPEEIDFGTYPQYAPSIILQEILKTSHKKGELEHINKDFTLNNSFSNNEEPIKYEVYKYKRSYENCGREYIYVENYCDRKVTLSNKETYKTKDYVWVEVSPVTWIIDKQTRTFISKRCLLSGIEFTNIEEYLNKYMVNDLFNNATFIRVKNEFAHKEFINIPNTSNSFTRKRTR